MSEKRRLSTRNRGEPPLKKRALSPPTPQAVPLPSIQPSSPPQTLKEGLPVKLKEGQALPTLPEKQDESLSRLTHQSIAESGILAASLQRSRERWPGKVLERFWYKPGKRRDMGSTPNPPKGSMTRLGVCSLIVDPHLFEVTLYTVRDHPLDYHVPHAPPPPPHSSLSTPQYNPFCQSQAYTSSSINAPSSTPQYQAQQLKNPSKQTLPPFREGFGSFGPQGPSPVYHPPVRPYPPPRVPTPATFPMQPNPPGTGISGKAEIHGKANEAQADPVIKMLASRAAHNEKLKDLMKLVADDKASEQQLREFQEHLDDLNSTINSGAALSYPLGSDGSTSTPTSLLASGYYNQQSRLSNPDVNWHYVHPEATAHSKLPSIRAEPVAPQNSVTTASQVFKAPSNNKNDVSGVVLDFGDGDRYSLPRFSILEYLYGGTQVLVSFIVVRAGSAAASSHYKGNRSYYQPVTLRLTSPHPRILEPLARVVASPEEVRNYMNNYFDRLQPAESVYLAMRLPRGSDAGNSEQEEDTAPPTISLGKPVYPPPDSIMPLAA